MQTKCFAIENVKRCDYHREYGGTLGMVPLIIDPIYTWYSGYLFGISPFEWFLGRVKQLGSFGAKRCHIVFEKDNTGMSRGFLVAVKSMVWVSNSYLLGYNVPQREFIYNLLAPVGLKCLWWWFLHFQRLMTWLLFIRCEAWIGHDWLFLFLLTFKHLIMNEP